ncbi:MAG: restriction endonuclease subunit S [Chthoniobacterales bacterium]
MKEWPDFDVPADWSLTRMDELAVKLKAGGTPNRKNKAFFGGDIPFVLIDDMTSSGVYLKSTKETITREGLNSSSAWIVPENTVLLSMYATIGATVITTFPVATNQAILAIIPNEECDREYLAFCLQAHKSHLARLNVESTQKNINKGIVSSFLVPLPPLPEQKKIAHILSTVQRAIEAQERIIQTTTELKKAIMHKLFTEGLPRRSLGEGGPPRHEPQKQTEIGPVPESWEVVALSECAVVQTGIAKGRKVNAEEAVEVPYLRVANVQDGYLDLSEMKTITIRKNEQQRFALQDGDVVLTEGGDFDKLGRGFIWHGEIENCVHQNHVFAVRPDKEQISSEFFAYQSQSPYGKSYFLSVAHKTTNLACINTTKLKAFPVLLPPQDQQEDIVEACRSIDGKIRNATNKKNQLQDLFRTILHELMTARIRVDVC